MNTPPYLFYVVVKTGSGEELTKLFNALERLKEEIPTLYWEERMDDGTEFEE
jgi:hypothetical protein